MSVLILSLIFQVICGIHAFKTGVSRHWLYFIIFVPGIGCFVYFVMRILPGFFSSQRTGKRLIDIVDPERGIRQHSENLEVSANVDNTINLAREYLYKNRNEEAVELLSNARTGIFTHDPKVLTTLAVAYFDNQQFAECKQILDELIEENPDFKWADGHLMYARCLEYIGDTQKALSEYETLSSYYSGPEAKYRYAKLLRKQGQHHGALAIFEEILRVAGRAPRHYRTLHKEWINKTKAQLGDS